MLMNYIAKKCGKFFLEGRGAYKAKGRTTNHLMIRFCKKRDFLYKILIKVLKAVSSDIL